jgi:signal transduction histidine kinase
MRVWISALIVWLAALLLPANLAAKDARPQSILFFDPSDLRGPFYHQIFSALRSVVSSDTRSHVTIFAESLDLSRFKGEAYEENLKHLFKEKYHDKAVGVLVAVGPATLDLVLRWRAELWPGIPVVFSMIDKADFERLQLPPGVTGSITEVKLEDSIKAARAVVPDLENIVFVGDSWDHQIAFANWKEEIPTATAGLNVIEIMGFKMSETRRRVAELPERSAIVYISMHSDGEGTFYPASTALSLIAETANRPIVVAAETFLTPGGIGGYVHIPALIGADAARLALRILNGETPSSLPVTRSQAVKPIFNWPQMQRWGVAEADLPEGSEIRFREPGLWERYRWQSVSVTAALLIQAALISILWQERRKRSDAELEARLRLSELSHLHRQSLAGELSSSIAHELNQPLGSILTNAETAELILNSPRPDLKEVREILSDIRQDNLRASQVIGHMRSLLKRTPFESKIIDINQIVRDAFDLLTGQAARRNVALYLETFSEPLWVKGDHVQLQQVMLNVVVNSMDSMETVPFGRTVIGQTRIDKGCALISISDSGPGIPKDKLGEIFDPFFTTKEQGIGVGLSIARTIVEAHKGRIWAENQPEGGAVFWVSLPLTSQEG